MSDIRTLAAEHLMRARDRSTALTDAVDDDDLVRQHSPLMSPLVWDLAHVGNQEELWLVRDVGRRDPVRSDIDELYDAFKHGRASRPSLPLLGPAEARAYVREVRDKALDVLDSTRLEGTRLVQDGFAFGMVVQHEQQHDETMLATHQLRIGAPVLQADEPPPRPRVPGGQGGARPGGRVHHGHVLRAVGPGQRAAGACVVHRGLSHRQRTGHLRRVPPVRRGRRLRAGAVVVPRRLAARARGRARGAAVPHP